MREYETKLDQAWDDAYSSFEVWLRNQTRKDKAKVYIELCDTPVTTPESYKKYITDPAGFLGEEIDKVVWALPGLQQPDTPEDYKSIAQSVFEDAVEKFNKWNKEKK